MWNREAAMFTAYASIIVYVLTASLSLLLGSPGSPSNIEANLMAPVTMIVVFITASIYLTKHRLERDSHGAALGAFSAFAVYCATVFCLMAIFYSSVHHWIDHGRSGHAPGAVGFYAIVFSPVLLPAALALGAVCGIAYMRLKRRFGMIETTHRKPFRRRRRISLVVVLTALVAIAVPTMILLGGPALLILGGGNSLPSLTGP